MKRLDLLNATRLSVVTIVLILPVLPWSCLQFADKGGEPRAKTTHAEHPDDPFMAALNGDIQTVIKHVEDDASVLRKRSPGGTLLHLAAHWNHPDIVRYLIDKGARVDALDEVGSETPLFEAAESPMPHPTTVARMLLERGADPNFRLGGKGKKTMRSVLDQAAYFGHDGIVKLLLEHSASPVTKNSYHSYTSLHWACRGPRSVAYWAPSAVAGRCASSVLAENQDNHRVIETLMIFIKDINVRDHCGRTPLHVAANHGRAKVVEYLLTAYPTVEIDAVDQSDNSPLHLAVQPEEPHFLSEPPKVSVADRIATITVLLKHGAETTLKGSRNDTPRERAVATGEEALIRLFPEPAKTAPPQAKPKAKP